VATEKEAFQARLPHGYEVLAQKQSPATVGHDSVIWWVKDDHRDIVLEGTERWIMARVGHALSGGL